MDRWSDWDFKATSKDNVLIYAWSTPFQMEVTEGDLDGWASVHVAKAKEEGSAEAKVTSKTVSEVAGNPSASIHVEMATESGTKLVMEGVSLPLKGKMLHIATIAASNRSKSAQKALNSAISDLDIKSPAAELEWGGAVSAEVSSATLSEGWRKPLKSEMIVVAKMAKSLTIPNLMGCWTAIHPVAGGTPDVMITCQEKKTVGIVDEYTLSDVEADLKTAWFGKTTEASGEALHLDDGRVGLLFASTIAGQNIHIMGVPNGSGLAKTIVASKGTSGLDVPQEIRMVANSSVVTPPPPVEFRDTAIYYLSYRPFHPFVLGPILLALVVFGLIIALIVVGARRQPSYDY
jgi:hypothetical protein